MLLMSLKLIAAAKDSWACFICDHMRSGEKLDPSVVINSGIRVGLSLEALH